MSAPELDPQTSVPDNSPYRTDGFVDLRSYAPIGDGRTVALVAEDGSIDWFPLPRLDSLPAFAAMLDASNGGRLQLAPQARFSVDRRYLPNTNVLETTFRTATGSIRVTDAINVGIDGPLPWTELARRVEGVEGEVEVRWLVAPGTCFNTAAPWARATQHGKVLRVGELTLGVSVTDGLDVEVTDQALHGTFTIRAGERRMVGLTASHGEPLMLSSAADMDADLDRTIDV